MKIRKKKSKGKFLLFHIWGYGFGNDRISELVIFQGTKKALLHTITTNRKWGRYRMSRGNDLV